MLSVEIVRIVEDYDGWDFPNRDSLKFNNDEEPSYSEVWEDEHLSEIYVEDHFPRLNEGDLVKLGNILKYDSDEIKKRRNHRLLSNFIKWYFQISSNDQFRYFCVNTEKWYFSSYKYFIEDNNDVNLQPDIEDELMFYREYFSRDSIRRERKKLGQIWFKRFQLMIDEGAERVPSDLLNSADPIFHRHQGDFIKENSPH